MKIGVVLFSGSNCDADSLYAFTGSMQQDVVNFWYKEEDLHGCELINVY